MYSAISLFRLQLPLSLSPSSFPVLCSNYAVYIATIVIVQLSSLHVAVIGAVLLEIMIFIAIVAGWLGSMYMKAQLSVKREMSNAKAPLLGIVDSTISGLSASLFRYLFFFKTLNTPL